MTPRRRSSFTLTLTTALALCASLSAHCTSNCATFAVSVVALDESTGALLCDAVVRFGSGAGDGGDLGDAGALLGGSAASSDAEVPATSASCQWETVVGGGTYSVDVTAPGFAPASATLDLAKDQCGTANVPVTVRMTHSGS